MISPLEGRRRPADAGTRARRLRFVAPQHRLSPHRVKAGHTDAVIARRRRHWLAVYSAHAAVVDNLKSQGRSRLVSMPVRPQFNVTELVAAGKQTDLETERLRLGLESRRVCSAVVERSAVQALVRNQC